MNWQEWVQELALPAKRCIHIISLHPDELRALRDWVIEEGLRLAEMQGPLISDDATLFEELAKALRFPGYFGRNWNALEECLRDLEWLPARGYVLLLTDADEFWDRAARTFIKLVDSWAFSADEWAKEAIPFHLVIEGRRVADDFRELPNRIAVH